MLVPAHKGAHTRLVTTHAADVGLVEGGRIPKGYQPQGIKVESMHLEALQRIARGRDAPRGVENVEKSLTRRH